jgi:hypothetical protein
MQRQNNKQTDTERVKQTETNTKHTDVETRTPRDETTTTQRRDTNMYCNHRILHRSPSPLFFA